MGQSQKGRGGALKTFPQKHEDRHDHEQAKHPHGVDRCQRGHGTSFQRIHDNGNLKAGKC